MKQYPHLEERRIGVTDPGVICECCDLPAVGRVTMRFTRSERDTFQACTIHYDMALDEPIKFCEAWWQKEESEGH